MGSNLQINAKLMIRVDTVELLDFMVTQFSLYLWVYIALPHKFISSTKTNLARVIHMYLLVKLKTDASIKLHPHK